MTAATGIAIGSLIVAACALGWTIYRDVATRHDVQRESADRKDQLAREEGRREEEIRLLRLQVERQANQTRGAELVAKSTGYSGSSSGVSFPMSARNVGDTVARDITIWLAIAPVDDGTAASAARVTNSHPINVLAPGDPPEEFQLHQAGASAGGGVPRDGLIVATWSDAAGQHTDAIGKLTVFL